MIAFKIMNPSADSKEIAGAKLEWNNEHTEIIIVVSKPEVTAVLPFETPEDDEELCRYVFNPVTEYGPEFSPPKAYLTILFLLFLANAKEKMPKNNYIYQLIDRAGGLTQCANFQTFACFDKKVNVGGIDEAKFWEALKPLEKHLNETIGARSLTSAPPAPVEALGTFFSQESESGCSILFMPCFLALLVVYLALYPIFYFLDCCLSQESKTSTPQRGLPEPRRIFSAYWHNDGLHSDFQVIFSPCFLTLFLPYALVLYPVVQSMLDCCHLEGGQQAEGEREPLCP